jgi:hypothetical protein
LVLLFGLIAGKLLARWNSLFLTTTVATNVTGFLFPFHKVTPGFVVGIISLIALGIAIAANNVFHFAGTWRKAYVLTALIALYLNVFVLIVQLFEKIPALRAMAPTQSEPPFKIAQLVTLLLFVILTIMATIRFRITNQ